MRLAASCARRSARRSAGWRMRATSSSMRAPSSGCGEITTPSSASVRLSAGIEPGTRPPTSAWCARGWRAWPAQRRLSAAKIGVITVMSGRCVPPAKGSLRIHERPGACCSSSTIATAAGIAPRCTGMCSACITICPSASNSAVEASRRSLMLAEWAERISTAPISSQAACSAPLITCSSIGSSALMPTRPVPGVRCSRSCRARRPCRSSPVRSATSSPPACRSPVPQVAARWRRARQTSATSSRSSNTIGLRVARTGSPAALLAAGAAPGPRPTPGS